MTDTVTPSRDIERLIEIMAALRTPGTGCPWDLEQTFATIAPYTIEEAYEVADAIERGTRSELKDELGDLLLQVAYHARMAEEEGSFAFGDVVYAVTRKMIRRHPHVFGTPAERAAGAAPDFWARVKAEEKAERSKEDGNAGQPRSLLDDVPRALPALSRAAKLQEKAARVGFDWPSLAPVLDKLREEVGEFESELRSPESVTDPAVHRQRVEEELGDILFVLANVARHLDLDPETALRRANGKFTRRFRHIEARLAETGRTPHVSTLDEMDRLWNEARKADKSRGSRSSSDGETE